MNDILHLVAVYEVLIYCHTNEGSDIGNTGLCIPRFLTIEWENNDNYDNDYGSNNGDWAGNTYHHVESSILAMHHT